MKDEKMQQEHIETATSATATTVASYASSGGLIVFGMSMHDFAAVVGVILAVATFAVNWYYRHKEYTNGSRRDR